MPEDPLIGFTVDGFRFDSLLGRGAMGAVYKGMQVAMDRPVAIKVIAAHLAEDDAYITRFHREAQTLGRLVHPHVIACHDTARCIGPHGNEIVLMVLEFVDGWSLGSLLKKKHRMTARNMLEIHRQAAEGLAAAHRLGIVHRDIKPDNIMVTRKGQAKLADFGLAKSDDSAMLTQTGAILGSPAYMSPEACRGAPPAPASDLYSLGCSLFHGLTGTTPYRASSAVQALHQHIHAPIPKISAWRPDLENLNELIAKLLAKKPEDRFQDAESLAAALKVAINEIPADSPAGVSTASPTENDPDAVYSHHATATLPPAKKTTRTNWKYIAASIGVILLILIVAATLSKKKPVENPLDANVVATLDEVESLLDRNQKSDAETLFKSLTAEQISSHPTLTERAAIIGQNFIETAKPPTRETVTPSKPVGKSRLELAEEHLAAGRLDEAESELSEYTPDANTSARTFGVRQRLKSAFKERIERAEESISAAEMLIKQGHLTDARKMLESTRPPKIDVELTNRYNRALEKTNAGKNTQVIRLQQGNPGFGDQALQIGYVALPAHIPQDTQQLFMSRESRIELTLPANLKTTDSGVGILIHSSVSCKIQATIRCGDERHERPAQTISGGSWEPIFISLDVPRIVTGIEIKAAQSNVVMYAATAVLTIGRPATMSDLDVIPGGLNPLPAALGRLERDSDYRVVAMRMIRSHSSFAQLDTIAVAYPANEKLRGEEIYKMSANVLNINGDSNTSLFSYSDSASLEKAFEAATGKADLLFIYVPTERIPNADKTAEDLITRCKKAEEAGTLPVLILSHHRHNRPLINAAWESYIKRIVAEVPLLPVIDLAVAPQFIKRYHIPVKEQSTDADRYVSACLSGGIQELIARLQWITTMSGGGRRPLRNE